MINNDYKHGLNLFYIYKLKFSQKNLFLNMEMELESILNSFLNMELTNLSYNFNTIFIVFRHPKSNTI